MNVPSHGSLASSSLELPGMPGGSQPLVRHVAESTGLPAGVATRVVTEVAVYFMESTREYVRRRHRELQAEGLRNDVIFPRINTELHSRPVAPPTLSTRQLRRIVYT
jgi:hypothetical protein